MFEKMTPENLREDTLHTIGNLTLLTRKLNPSVSNGPRDEKLPAILDHTVLNLNRKLQHIKEWDEKAILQRSMALFELAKKIWSVPMERGSGQGAAGAVP